MADLLVRNVPEATVRRLKQRAKRHGHSLQAEALSILQQGARTSGTAFVEVARAGGAVASKATIFSLLGTITLVSMRPLAERAAEIAPQIDRPIYDFLYLALAEVADDVLLTADERLQRKLATNPLRRRIRLIA